MILESMKQARRDVKGKSKEEDRDKGQQARRERAESRVFHQEVNL